MITRIISAQFKKISKSNTVMWSKLTKANDKLIKFYLKKGQKAIFKILGLLHNLLGAIINKWRKHWTVENFTRNIHLNKFTSGARQQFIKNITKT